MSQSQPQNYDHLIHKLEADHEVVVRRLDKANPARPWYRRDIEEKQRLERALAHLRRLSEGQKPIGAGSGGQSKAKWFESSQDVLKRRQIVLKNPGFKAESLCKVFDAQRIPLPASWENELQVDKWVKAYKVKKSRPRIQRIISTDRKQE